LALHASARYGVESPAVSAGLFVADLRSAYFATRLPDAVADIWLMELLTQCACLDGTAVADRGSNKC
jgi:hypothetical protein